jgi:hypothetical protein
VTVRLLFPLRDVSEVEALEHLNALRRGTTTARTALSDARYLRWDAMDVQIGLSSGR